MSLIATLLIYLLYAFIIVVFVRVVFSWLSPYPTNSVSRFAFRITEPVLGRVRRWIPPVSGIDLSPLVVTVAAYFLVAFLRNFGG